MFRIVAAMDRELNRCAVVSPIFFNLALVGIQILENVFFESCQKGICFEQGNFFCCLYKGQEIRIGANACICRGTFFKGFAGKDAQARKRVSCADMDGFGVESLIGDSRNGFCANKKNIAKISGSFFGQPDVRVAQGVFRGKEKS